MGRLRQNRYVGLSAATSIANSIIGAGSVFFLLPAVISNIGLERYGIWAALGLFQELAGFADLGLSKAIVYLLPGVKKKEDRGRILLSGLAFHLIVLLIALFVFIGSYLAKIPIWGHNASLTSSAGESVFLAGLVCFFFLLGIAFCRASLEAVYRLPAVHIAVLLTTLCNFGALYVLSNFTSSVKVFLWATVLVYALSYIAHIVMVILWTRFRFSLPNRSDFQSLWRVMSGFLLIGVLTSILQPLNRYLLVIFTENQDTYAIFDVGLRVTSVARSSLIAFTAPLFSVIAGFRHQAGSHQKGTTVIWRFTKVSGSLWIAGLVVYFFIGEYILRWITKSEALEPFWITGILLIGIGFVGVVEGFWRGLWGFGRLRVAIAIRAATLLVNIALLYSLSFLPAIYQITISFSASAAFGGLLALVVYLRIIDTSELQSDHGD